MKGISLHQPFASLMAVGAKVNETRSWSTTYRGPLAICSARCAGEMSLRCSSWLWQYKDALGPSCGNVLELFDELPRGFVLCVVDLVDCLPTGMLLTTTLGLSAREQELGNYEPGRFAWITTHCRRLAEPFPIKGRQGLFNLTTAEEFEVMERRYVSNPPTTTPQPQ